MPHRARIHSTSFMESCEASSSDMLDRRLCGEAMGSLSGRGRHSRRNSIEIMSVSSQSASTLMRNEAPSLSSTCSCEFRSKTCRRSPTIDGNKDAHERARTITVPCSKALAVSPEKRHHSAPQIAFPAMLASKARDITTSPTAPSNPACTQQKIHVHREGSRHR